MYLLDTNVVSELRKPKPHGGVIAWIQSVAEDDLFISALTLGELQAGAERTRMRGLIVVTRNVRDFKFPGIEILNPFTAKT